MRGLFAALCQQMGWMRPRGVSDMVMPKDEGEDYITYGGPYFVWTDHELAGPYWPAIRGPRPEGFLPEPADESKTYSYSDS